MTAPSATFLKMSDAAIGHFFKIVFLHDAAIGNFKNVLRFA
jgi:hypothetical protein